MKKAVLMTGAALALLIVAAVGAFAYGGYGMGSDASAAGVERGAYHDRMEQVLESGAYQDLVRLRQETGMPIMPWVDDEASFQQAQEQHASIEAQYGEGPHMGAYGPRDGTGFRRGMMGGYAGSRGFGGDCPMWDD